MPLIFNGVTVTEVIYNGTRLDNLVYNGVEVFTREKFNDDVSNITPAYTGTNNGNSITLSNGVQASTLRSCNCFGDYWRGALDSDNTIWWAGVNVQNDNSLDEHTFQWSDPKWLDRIEVTTANTDFWAAAPYKWDIYIERGDNRGNFVFYGEIFRTGEGTDDRNQKWYFRDEFKFEDGIYGIQIKALNNSSYKAIPQSTRHNKIDIWCGTVNL